MWTSALSDRRRLRAGRAATFAYFGLDGFVLGMWIVHIPVIEDRVGVGHAVLGWLLLLFGAGALVGMQTAGPLTDRAGARAVVPLSGVLCSAALVLPAFAVNAWTLGAALVVLGVTNGALNVSMNSHAVQVEHGYRRPVMSAFHATFSLGGVLAALVGARTLGWGWSPVVSLGAAAVSGVVVAVLIAPALLRDSSPGAAPGGRARTRAPRRIWMMAALALMVMLSEGVANDWSTLHLRDALDASASTAAFAYGAFATAMTAGRLLADRVAARFGPVAVLRYGAALAASGLAVAALSPWIPAALAGWALAGAGLSGCVPQIFSAAGHHDRDAVGANVSRVAGVGYLGMIAGPAVIGPLTHVMPLNLTFFLPVALCAVAAASAGILRTPRTAPDAVQPVEEAQNPLG